MAWRSGQSYSEDLRERVLAAVDGGMGAYEAAPLFRVSVSYIYKALGRRQASGEVTAKPCLDRPGLKLAVLHEALRARVRAEPGATLAELRLWLLAEHGLSVSTGCLWTALDRLDLTHKKVLRAAEQDREDVAQARAVWREQRPGLDPKHLVFLDETWTTTAMTRPYGRGPRGERVVDSVPAGHWKITTFVCGLRHDGLTAPMTLDGAMNGAAFLASVEQVLAPTLLPGDIVVLDNLSAHKVAGVRERVAVRGASVLYLPAYSPDLNPIEQAFAKLKALLRKAAVRTIKGLWDAIGSALFQFSPDECANYLANSGYPRSA